MSEEKTPSVPFDSETPLYETGCECAVAPSVAAYLVEVGDKRYAACGEKCSRAIAIDRLLGNFDHFDCYQGFDLRTRDVRSTAMTVHLPKKGWSVGGTFTVCGLEHPTKVEWPSDHGWVTRGAATAKTDILCKGCFAEERAE